MNKLNKEAITDEYIRENFNILEEEISNNQELLRGNWKHFEITVDKAVTNYDVKHNLGFKPTELLITFQSIAGVTINYSSFTKENINITTTGAATIRGFYGSYK